MNKKEIIKSIDHIVYLAERLLEEDLDIEKKEFLYADIAIERHHLLKAISEPTTKSETSEKANDIIPDVSDMFSFGDIVKAKCTAIGRYIGKGKCVYISAMTNDRCVDNVKEKCENNYDLPVVDDNELENYR